MVRLHKDYYIDGHSDDLLWKKFHWGREVRPPNYTPGVDFLDHDSHQDLSNEGSNFILSSLEVGLWVAQT